MRADLSEEDVATVLGSEKSYLWVDIADPTKPDMSWLGSQFGFHKLTLEDCLTREDLPKVDDYGDYIFMIWNAVILSEGGRVASRELDIYLGKKYLVTVHARDIPAVDAAARACAEEPCPLASGPEWLLHFLLDKTVDDYFPVVDGLGEDVDRLEETVFESPSRELLRELFVKKHEIVKVRRVCGPQRDIINTLLRYDAKLLDRNSFMYFQDINDHMFRILDQLDTTRDIIGGAMDIYLSSVSNRLNEVMKHLTIVATIFMPLTLISGIYGMNFRYMPELVVRGFYFGVLAFMAAVVVGMLVYFRKKDWW